MIKRLMIFGLGILALAFGIVLNTKTALGVSSISSLPFVLSKISFLTLGQATMLMYIIYILAQTILLRKILLKVVLQLPFSFIFGLIVDFFDSLLAIQPSNMVWSLIYLVLAIVITAFGAYLVVSMNVILNPADGIVNSIAYVSHQEFGTIKLIFDCSMVSLSLIVSWLFSRQFLGFGIGTIASAMVIGKLITQFKTMLKKKLERIYQHH